MPFAHASLSSSRSPILLGAVVLLSLLFTAQTSWAQVVVNLTPDTASVITNKTRQFAASVSGTTNTGVKWYVDGILGGDATSGTITTSGLYTAPATPGDHTVSITSNADPSVSDSSAVTVTEVTIAISPTSVSLSPSQTKQFAATVTGTTNTGVKWYVNGILGGDSASGTITTGGLYTAPPTGPGNHTVMIISNADTTKSASSAVTIGQPITVTLSPSSTTVTTSTTRQFQATVTGTTNLGVKWYVDDVLGGNSTSGTITTSGLYTAPTTAGNHTVKATSNADPTKFGTSAVTVAAPTPVTISIIPTSATVNGGETKQFQSVVSGSSNVGVKWYVDGILGGNDTVGPIYTNGIYSAPNFGGNHTVTITANADPTKSANSAVHINSVVYVVVDPQQSPCVVRNSTLQFTAQVFGTTNQNVTWQVNSRTGGSSTTGFISSTGLYTANTSGTFTVRAISQANSTKSASVSVRVQSSPSVSMSPTSYTVLASQPQQIRATLCGSNADSLKWSVNGVLGGDASVGTIDSAGIYTAPASGGPFSVKAASSVDSTKSATGTINLLSSIRADFGGRANDTEPIAPGLFNAQLTNLTNTSALQTLKDAGFDGVRQYSFIQDVYATQTPDWTKIDPTIQRLKDAGLKPILEIAYTPPWLVPDVAGCTKSYRMPPTNVTKYGEIAAAMVTHFEQQWPGFVQDYEIWNEPDLSPFCVANNSDSTRRAKYVDLYAAVAPQMKAAAAAAGTTIRIGGPSTVTGSYITWIPALVSDPRTAPYVDFISYHHYLSGQTEARGGMGWDTTTTGPKSLFDRTQEPAGSGAASYFKAVATRTAAGTQPNASTTPVYLDEYNDGWWFGPSCCRNSFTYSPVFNTLYIADMLNSVYDAVPAPNTPGKIYYYSASAFPYFCMLGAINTKMDCAAVSFEGYPQFYAYKLLASTNYLGLSAGGFMARSVSPLPSQAQGLAATAFYTSSGNAIVIINSSNIDYSGVSVQIDNPGFGSAQGTVYLLNDSNRQITSSPLSLSVSGNGFQATVNVPKYSVVGISVKP